MQLITNGFLTWLLTAALSLQPTSLDSEFIRLEDRWNAAHRDADADSLAALCADDPQVIVPRMPPMTKGESLAFARTGRMKFERYETSQIKVRSYGDTTVVTGNLIRTRTVAGKATTDDWTFTKVYARQNGSWRVVSFHASDSPPSQ